MGKRKSNATRGSTLKPLLLLIIFGAVFGAGIAYAYQFVNQQQTTPIAETTSATFVDNETCAGCHVDQFEQWTGSHHEQAMQPANAETVLANFDDVSFSDAGVTSRFFERDGSYFVNTVGENGEYADYKVAYTFGVEPLQQYLLEFPNGQLQAFTVAWDVAEESWFSLYQGEQIAPNDPLHWTSNGFTANSSCIDCHTTNMQLNYDVASDSYATTWDEVNVSCQACHGPGSEHVAWAEEGGNSADLGLINDYDAIDSAELADSCARCHSRRYPITEDDAYGHSFYDDFMPELLRENLYHADGQMLDEVYVYGSFTQSKMFHAGVSCVDCHNPHTADVHAPGNVTCITCHQPNPPSDRFPQLQAKVYDSAEHHNHPSDSEGAQCVSCHMPVQTYMVVDPRHDHSFPTPRPDMTTLWGTPNTCNSCHIDQSPEWAASAMDQWYGTAWRARPTIASSFALGRVAAPEAETSLIEIAGDQGQPAIVRATALELLQPYGANGLTANVAALDDASPLIRATSLTGLTGVPQSQIVQVVALSLSDPVRAVRIAAAQALVGVPREAFTDEQWRAFQTALDEYIEAQLALADHPEGHANLGSLYAVQGDWEKAEASYRTAIEKAPNFLPAYQGLATFFYQTGRVAEAEATLRDGMAAVANAGMLHYTLGLLFAEQARLDEAIVALGRSADLLPNSPRIHYNYGLLLQQAGQFPSAEAALLEANRLAPSDSDTLLALAEFYLEIGRFDDALIYARQLNELFPNNVQFIELVTLLEQQ